MSDHAAGLFLAAQYASSGSFRPLGAFRRRDGIQAVETLEALGLLSAAGAGEWRGRFARLDTDPATLPLLPDEIRTAAQAFARGPARHQLELVGALSWSDRDEGSPVRGLELDRVIPVPPDPSSGDLEVSAIAIYGDLLAVHAFAATPEHSSGRPAMSVDGSFGVRVVDDLQTAYTHVGHASGGGARDALRAPWCARFEPAPPATARWLDISAGASLLAHVPLV